MSNALSEVVNATGDLVANLANNTAELTNAALTVDVSAASVLVSAGFLYGGYRLFRWAQDSDE